MEKEGEAESALRGCTCPLAPTPVILHHPRRLHRCHLCRHHLNRHYTPPSPSSLSASSPSPSSLSPFSLLPFSHSYTPPSPSSLSASSALASSLSPSAPSPIIFIFISTMQPISITSGRCSNKNYGMIRDFPPHFCCCQENNSFGIEKAPPMLGKVPFSPSWYTLTPTVQCSVCQNHHIHFFGILRPAVLAENKKTKVFSIFLSFSAGLEKHNDNWTPSNISI